MTKMDILLGELESLRLGLGDEDRQVFGREFSEVRGVLTDKASAIEAYERFRLWCRRWRRFATGHGWHRLHLGPDQDLNVIAIGAEDEYARLVAIGADESALDEQYARCNEYWRVAKDAKPEMFA